MFECCCLCSLFVDNYIHVLRGQPSQSFIYSNDQGLNPVGLLHPQISKMDQNGRSFLIPPNFPIFGGVKHLPPPSDNQHQGCFFAAASGRPKKKGRAEQWWAKAHWQTGGRRTSLLQLATKPQTQRGEIGSTQKLQNFGRNLSMTSWGNPVKASFSMGYFTMYSRKLTNLTVR